MGDIADLILSPGREDGIGAFGPDARDAHQRQAVGSIDLNGLSGDISLRPGKFWVDAGWEVAILLKGQFFQVEAIVSEEKRSLV